MSDKSAFNLLFNEILSQAPDQDAANTLLDLKEVIELGFMLGCDWKERQLTPGAIQ